MKYQFCIFCLVLTVVCSCQRKKTIDFKAEDIKLDNKKTSLLFTKVDSLQTSFFEIATLDSTTLMDNSKHVILLIGDSMGQGLRLPLKKNAETNGHKFVSAVERSSTIMKWSDTKKLDKLIKEHKPNYIIISLGSNELFTKQLDFYKKRIQKLIDKMPKIKFIWIGAPIWKKDFGMEAMMAKKIGKGQYFDSKKIIIPRAGDGVHPTWRGYKLWADSLSTWIMNNSRHKIMLKPDTTNQAMYR